ncbi:hypothetical protein M436DRAFT_81678 [Aureobasidium namibiae CBS 147.97]|uniref:C2H2-type domain-containing protein n=1 Tax=Aureobasidium namibiae CBS 147.97 TaxID=1043004 RepID=A0A074WU82_9PEZI
MSDNNPTPVPDLSSPEALQIPDLARNDEEALTRVLVEFLAEPTPGPVMGTFDGETIELTEDNMNWMAETATAAGRGLTVKGKRRQHYMTFSPPHPGTTMVWVADTPPETPPPGPSPVPVQATVAAVVSDGQAPVPLPRGGGHVGAGIRKRPFKCAYCHSTFSSVARRTAHVEKNHADKLASSAGSSNQTPQN